MNDNAALNLIRNTFENSFDKKRFLIFAKNLFKSFDESKAFQARGYVKDKFKKSTPVIKTYERLGTFTDTENNKIDILIVYLEKDDSLDRARTTQRNFVGDYLKDRDAKDAALVAFVTPSLNDWRLSLVKMDYHLGESKAGKIKAITELTPARRFSFLVGANENTHTAQRQLLPILKDTDLKPALTDLESAFSVEVVTKDFFEKYKKLFLDTKEALDAMVVKDAKIKADFKEKNIDTTDFAKKLLGQIVFLYFLQKKGWFGVKREQEWGSGPKAFLRELFEGKHGEYKNFFNEVLEPLFYATLAVERPYDIADKFNCRIPFLNGGLFDPLNSYDWYNTDIFLPNELFSNEEKTKEGDNGTGILDVFDRYNFTVKEDEPLEREVAVDPEMLGKVFENLLEVKDRKSKGTYYTPREIVHYMCQESLINYLLTELAGKVNREDIETLIRLGETAIEHDKVVLEHGEEKGRYTFKLPQSIRDNANLLDEKLEKIHVCDPAVGSGAFLVGMMTEVIRVRNVLTNYLSDNGRSIYDFKRHAIQNCLYGVDIDPGAVEIAKLRLWLSLIVDEQDIKQIKPLPNLDYKIMQGNSLLEEYEGVKLDVDGHGQPQQMKFDQAKTESEILKEKLVDLRKEFFRTAHKTEKDALKKQIEDLTWQLIEVSLKEQKKLSLLPEIERFKKTNVKPFFLWKLNFSEVFERIDGESGFDVVIANPPYVSAWSMTTEDSAQRTYIKRQLKDYPFLVGHWDLYIAFVGRGHHILKQSGNLAYIVPNPILREKYASEVRRFLLEEMRLLRILAFNEVNVFEKVSRRTTVFIAIKEASLEAYKINILGNTNGKIELMNSASRQEWLQNPKHMYLVESNSAEGDLVKRIGEASERIGNFFYVNYGAQVSSKKKGVFGKSDVVSFNRIGNAKQFYEGKDVQRWSLNYRGLWLDYKQKEIYGPRAPELFETEKVVIRKVSNRGHKLAGTLDTTKRYTDDGNILLVPYQSLRNTQLTKEFSGYKVLQDNVDLKYALAILLSKIETFYYRKRFATESLQGATSHTYPMSVRALPIREISPKEQRPFVDLVDKILATTKESDYLQNLAKQAEARGYEKQIDELVYKLYGLTPEEIEIVEDKNE